MAKKTTYTSKKQPKPEPVLAPEPVKHTPKSRIQLLKMLLWFVFGAMGGLFFFLSFVFIYYQKSHAAKVYPGVFIEGVDFGNKSQAEVEAYFLKKNQAIAEKPITLKATPDAVATTSAKALALGYDAQLLASQAYSIGRSADIASNIMTILQAYTSGIALQPSYHYSEKELQTVMEPIVASVNTEPIEALFTFTDGRVTEFQTSKDGKAVDTEALQKKLLSETITNPAFFTAPALTITVPVKTKKPRITTEKVNNLGIKELIASGTSLFAGSIPNRIYNLSLAASRINGVLIEPGEVFSFNETIGDVSAATGYKQAYVIQNGKTILGDGGGVCQVSTTFFRAALNAGLPIKERNPHAYRVHYYEEDSGPGIDAAIYTPSVDLKIVNDTGHYILVQSIVDEEAQRLTFNFYGTKDGREVSIAKPVIVSQSPEPEPRYEDDPTLPKGTVKQIDFAAAGANVYFTRTVSKDGSVILSDKFVSNYRPWQAVYLRGTKE